MPALGALAAEPLYVLVDTAIVGHLGTPQLAGLGVATAVILSGYWLFSFLAYGTTGTVSRLLGAGETARATAQGVQGVWLGLLLGVAVGALGLVFAEPLVGAIGPTDAVRPYALEYFRISMAGIPALLVVLAGTGYLRGLQDTRTPLVVTVATVVANIVLEVALVYGLDWGMAGSAWGTVVAQTAGALWYVRIIARSARADGAALRPDPAVIRRLARLSVHLVVRTAALRAALLASSAVITRLGTHDIAAHQVAFEIWMFLALSLDAIAIAGQALAGRLLGAGDAGRARAATTRMLELSIVVGGALAAVVLLLRPWLPALFTDDASVRDLAAFVLVFVALQQPMNGVIFALDGILIGAGDLRYLAGAMALAAAIYIPLTVAVLVAGWGIGWVWTAFSVMQLVRLATLLHRWRGDAWMVTGADR